jgi:hypothetical protein
VSRSFLALFTACAVSVSVSVASASVQFNLDTEYNHDSNAPSPLFKPQGEAPWLMIRIFDSSDALTVDVPAILAPSSNQQALIVMDARLINNEYFSIVGLNYDGPQSLSLSYLGGDLPNANVSYGISYGGGRSVDGSEGYEISFNLGNEGGASFGDSETLYFLASVSSGVLDDQDFVQNPLLPGGSNFPYDAAARVDGIPNNGGTEGSPAFIHNSGPPTPAGALPEPASLAIWGLGLGIAGLVRLRRKK